MRNIKTENNNSDFSKGSVWKHIASIAVPMTIAQVVQLLYNIVDRVYIGHLPENASYALAGLGLTFPLITIILAVTNLFGMGGAPLFSIARGRGDNSRAERIMGNTFAMLCIWGVILMILCFVFMKPLLYLFGTSDITYPYAAEYMMIYSFGIPFSMIATGMNGFINAQGFAKSGMATVLVGAVTNIILDPVFIFIFNMGVAGAALATIISQFLSAVWVLSFFRGRRTMFRLNKNDMKIELPLIKEIIGLGTAGFVMNASNGLVQIACNTTLKSTGGDIYVSIMTVLSSLRDVTSLPASGLTNASQPVLGFNYGAGEYDRVKSGIKFTTISGVIFMLLIWFVLFMFPEAFMRIFTADTEIISKGVPALHIYFFGIFMMAFQFSGQSTFVGLGFSKHAVFFSMLRKVIIVVPLTLILPHVMGLGVNGVFLAEPISNFIGGTACFVTMLFTVGHRLKTSK